MTKLTEAFRYWRLRDYPAHGALARARGDIAANISRYPGTRARGPQVWKAMDNGLQWCDPEQIGLRFVGWQDEILDLGRNSHRGWFTDEFQEEVLRGCVYQIPGRNGKAIFFPGYREGRAGRHGWTDTSGTTNAAIHFKDAFSYTDADDAKRDAARAADRFAELAAEETCAYNEAWQQGSEFASLGEQITVCRRNTLALIREVKQSGTFPPAICETLRAKIQDRLQEIRTARERRAELLGMVWDKYRAAFNEGAGINPNKRETI